MTSWTKEAVHVLIDAYKNESCLYATKNPNYHNKNLRNEALQRISTIVSAIRPDTSGKECSIKFHNLRNQFNTENAKVRASLKSGIGTENIYKPNLWYYNDLKFLEEHVIPRKSRTSQISSKVDNSQSNSEENIYSQGNDNSQESRSNKTYENDGTNISGINLDNYNEESQLWIPVLDKDIPVLDKDKAVEQPVPECTKLQNLGNTSNYILYSEENATLASSSLDSTVASSASNVYNTSFPTSSRKKRKSQNEDVYVGAIEAIAQSLKTPLTPACNFERMQ